jgi:DNA-binding IclR family transcriptional regulator
VAVKANLSIEKAVALLRAAARMSDGGSVTALASAAGIPRATASRLLATMEAQGLVQRSEHGDRFVLGYELGRLGRAADLNRGLMLAARPALDQLVAECRETVTLAVPRPGPSHEVILQVDAPHAVRAHDWFVDHQPMHATSTGKLLLAELDEVELKRFLGRGLERCASATIVDPQELQRHLAQVRDQGWSQMVNELEDGLAAVSAPIRDGQNGIVAVIGVTGPTSRFGEAERVRAATAIQRSIVKLGLSE